MNICVYGASSGMIDKSFFDSTYELGKEIARRGHTVIFGGGAHGVMGAVARGAKSENGGIIGVAPRFFDMPGILYDECTDFIFTENMAERKIKFEELADGYIVCPGGTGTFEEFFQAVTQKQLGQIKGAIAIYNPNGYYETLIKFLEESNEKGFINNISMSLFKFFEDIDEMITYIEEDDVPLMDIKATKY